VPRLPAIPFFDRAQFPSLDSIEAKTEVIRADLEAALVAARDRLVGYIQYAPGRPVNQWQELDHSLRWSTLHLWRNGKPVEDNLARCPETARALAALPLVDIGGLTSNAMFSALAPKSQIPPHNGETNARVIAHLPLIVPEACSYCVDFDWRPWHVGETPIFGGGITENWDYDVSLQYGETNRVLPRHGVPRVDGKRGAQGLDLAFGYRHSAWAT
jgi:aspartate beta-hydroxylase